MGGVCTEHDTHLDDVVEARVRLAVRLSRTKSICLAAPGMLDALLLGVDLLALLPTQTPTLLGVTTRAFFL